ncbi:pimeloyl-ACP methyl ester carboxylesterase [Neomicrococcus aestuarii]|uniref:Pimeloyl-ACP methyl ester carboxylesterase n=1 Tax=Neomicrococcus aestuarii TaxID=556325 RepID=A0A7W8WY60_9MICC|nr:alpha/beta hydrolase [Neomicrococcus aestuarii]MBB5511986.1 pimeloyl-ACP methyl ester carboxylesterase [Neomicrococcus aestuarii]
MQSDQPLNDDRPAVATTVRVEESDVRVYTYPATVQHQRAIVDEVSGHFKATSDGVILAIHGFRGDHHGLRRIINALPEYTFVVPDLPGFGESTAYWGTKHDVAGYGLVIQALKKVLGISDTAILLGHSYGSIVTSAFMAQHPGSFQSLILINPICEPALESSQRALSYLAQGYYGFARLLPRDLGESFIKMRLATDVTSFAMTKSKDADIRRYVFNQHRTYFGGFASIDVLQQSYESSIKESVRDYATRIPVPTLLIVGELDELGSVPKQEHLASLFPDARLTVIPRVGHLIHYETPFSAAAAVRGFLQ